MERTRKALSQALSDGLGFWVAGFTLGLSSALLIFKLFFPYQLAKQALSEV